VTTEEDLERQAKQVEQVRGGMEPALEAMLLAALATWLQHFSLASDRPEGPVRETVERMLIAQAERATRAAGRALWPTVAGATGPHAAEDVPRTPRVQLGIAHTAAEWARIRAHRVIKERKEHPVESPAGVELPARRSSSMQPQETPRAKDHDWAKAAARTLGVQAISELEEELSKLAPAPLKGAKLNRVWITRGDHKVRDSHRDLHGEARSGTAPFKRTGAQVLAYPGDPRAPLDETIGCRCVLVYSTGTTAQASRAIGQFPELPEEPIAASAYEAVKETVIATAGYPLPFHSIGDSAFVALLPKDPVSLTKAPVGSAPDDLKFEGRLLAPEELHVTLGYVGKNNSAEVGPDAYHAIDELCCSAPHRYQEMRATVTGVEEFGHSGEKATVLTLDVPEAHQLRDELTHHLDERDSLTSAYTKYPAYKPHITIGYDIDPDSPWIQELVGTEIVLDRVVATWKQMAPRHFQLRPE